MTNCVFLFSLMINEFLYLIMRISLGLITEWNSNAQCNFKLNISFLRNIFVQNIMCFQPLCPRIPREWTQFPQLLVFELFSWTLEAAIFRFKQKRDCIIHEAKTKALISCAVTAQLICVFVFTYAIFWFPCDTAHLT